MTERQPHICMLAAENDVIPGAKVGGIGDVLRDLPAALAVEGAHVSVLIPAYGLFHRLRGAEQKGSVVVSFAGGMEPIELFEVFADRDAGVNYFVLHNPRFAACGEGNVYCDDPDGRPFATDATKFALFGLAAATVVRNGLLGKVDVLHCHDWHAAFALILRAQTPGFESLRTMRTVFSIHNLALQGIRPFADDTSALYSWYPGARFDRTALADPRWYQCVNPMAAGIRLADRVHTVSPSYAREILQPNVPERGFHGGEGLELDLQRAAQEDRMVGIINGVHYAEDAASAGLARADWSAALDQCIDALAGWIGRGPAVRSVDYLAHQGAIAWRERDRPPHVITSVGRLTSQKVALLLEPLDDGRLVLDALLEVIRGRGVLILLGSGDALLEQRCGEIAARRRELLFLNGYSAAVSNTLFALGDLFLMPSSFEPCGISQMLAMRQAQPCLVHAVGGLKDTVSDDVDGFHFSGATLSAQATALVTRFRSIIELREQQPQTFERIARQAAERRFSWQTSARRYITELYA